MRWFISNNATFLNRKTGVYKICTVEDSLRYLNSISQISVDTETTYTPSKGADAYTDKFLSVQLGDEYHQFVIDTDSVNVLLYKSVLERNGVTYVLQNAIFDVRFFYVHGIAIPKVWDTMIAEAIITTGYGDRDDIKHIKEECGDLETAERYADRKTDLGSLAKKYCNKVLDKAVRGNIQREGLTERVIKYGAEDVEFLPVIKQKQIKELHRQHEKYGLSSRLVLLEMKAVLVFAKMLHNGFKIDKDRYKTEVIDIVEKEAHRHISELNNIVRNNGIKKFYTTNTGQLPKPVEVAFNYDMFSQELVSNINWASPSQKLGILRTSVPELENTNSKVLAKYAKASNIIPPLLEFNRFNKLSNAFGKSFIDFINPVTGKIHTNIWQVLSTGRISMNKPK